jgi:hypothetical protein
MAVAQSEGVHLVGKIFGSVVLGLSNLLGTVFCGVSAYYSIALYYGWKPTIPPVAATAAFTPMSPMVPILGFGLGILLLISSWVVFYKSNRSARPQLQNQKSETPPEFKQAADYFKTFDNPVVTDVETVVRAESDKYEPGGEREKYLVRALASVTTISAFEITYLNIFGSQLRALDELRTHPEGLTVEELRHYFIEGLRTVPDVFRNRTFEQWLDFLLAINKLVEQEGTTIKITVLGQEFLRYIFQRGYSLTTRLG